MTFDLDPCEPERFIHPERDSIRHDDDIARQTRDPVAYAEIMKRHHEGVQRILAEMRRKGVFDKRTD